MRANTVGMNYTRGAGNLLPLYADLIAKYRILIYSGDVDGCVPYWGAEQVRAEAGMMRLMEKRLHPSTYASLCSCLTPLCCIVICFDAILPACLSFIVNIHTCH